MAPRSDDREPRGWQRDRLERHLGSDRGLRGAAHLAGIDEAEGAAQRDAGGGGDSGDIEGIVGTALGANVFTQLAAYVVNAGLVETLRGGTFTVFAPTDEAFSKLPAASLNALSLAVSKSSAVL